MRSFLRSSLKQPKGEAMTRRIEGKVVIVTGAGSIGPGIGNGKAAAIIYAREGGSVLLVDNNLNAAMETKSWIDSEGGTSIPYITDVGNSINCKNVVEECIKIYGRVDILHNNIGIEIPGGIDEMSEESWDRVLNVNLKSMFLLCKYALVYMDKQESGVIVNISSINAIRSLPALSIAYSVSKAGVIALTREIAVQYAPKGVRANAILPGMMNTPMVTAALTNAYGGNPSQMHSMRDQMCPTKKQGEPWDTAYLSLFLASDEAKYITGASFIVDGGLTCTAGRF
jgi:NAD(P)-dependent dehydrogenase (short-subunit alcohol dehydrogenase family)